ncbi:MAG: hypothetical protein RLZZ267_92 [Bacillota bacterium]|jgi:hypothetical protein
MSEEIKKVSLADAVKQKLAQQKQAQNQGNKGGGFNSNQPKALKTQSTKKINNQRKRMGV